jgi:3,4-dihydroxy 2-butanone 4-phosphate synthase/GTP cyclohydrolase II
VSIEAAQGISTGISAEDRARTIIAASKKNARAEDIVQPGHIFPLRAFEGGVLSRAGHTEAACDLARLAGLEEAGVICEIMNEDGSMARRDDLMEFAATHEMRIGTIADLIHYRTLKEKSVHLEFSKSVEVDGLTFELSAWRDSIFNNLHLAFVKGDLALSSAPLVRVHVPNTLHDLIGIEEFGKRLNLKKALKRIGKEECGVLLLIGNYQDANEVLNDLKGAKSSIKPETKTVGIGAQILKELGLQQITLLGTPVKYPSLSGFDLEVTGFEQ